MSAKNATTTTSNAIQYVYIVYEIHFSFGIFISCNWLSISAQTQTSIAYIIRINAQINRIERFFFQTFLVRFKGKEYGEQQKKYPRVKRTISYITYYK